MKTSPTGNNKVSELLPDSESDSRYLKDANIIGFLRGDDRLQVDAAHLEANREEALRLMCIEHGIDFGSGTWLIELLFALARKVYPRPIVKRGRKPKWSDVDDLLVKFANQLISAGEAKNDSEAAKIIIKRANLDRFADLPDMTQSRKMTPDAVRRAIRRARERTIKIASELAKR